MKILAIGLGGAGSRIVDHLYDHDRHSNVNCVTPIAIDIGGSALQQLRFIPENSRINYSRMDPATQVNTRTTLDFEEIMTIIQKMDTVDIHAIIIFGGLGGNLVDAIPILAKNLRKSYVEPVFAVCTLPYLSEGKSCSAKAADDLEMIDASVDALILFDNETWYHKILASFEEDKGKNHARGKNFLKQKNPDNPRDMYRLLNERIARQVGLLLRAGEFNEAGVETAEIVLDAGEVLNTLTGNGLTAIGYAIEALPHSWHDRLDKWRSKTYFTEGSHRKATRMVSLAKKAVYEDISIPCDLTSADKALVLIGGPSQELSMKGFQTVRKWIDKSIAGLEMRSGDYPVRNTKYVAIIIMLSGLHNIPRIEEIKKLRTEYLAEKESEEKRIEEERQRLEAELLLNREYADESSEQETGTGNDDNCLIEEVETFIKEIRTGVAREEPDINAPDNPDLQKSGRDISEINRKVPESANNSPEINRNIPELPNNSPEITEDNSETIKDFSEPTGRGNTPVTDRTGIIIADETTTGNDSATVSFIDLLEDETEEEEMDMTGHNYNSSGSGQETYLDYSDENNPYADEKHTMTDKNHALTSKDYVISEEIYGKSQDNIETKSLKDEMISIPDESDRENNMKSGSKNSSSKKLKDECISLNPRHETKKGEEEIVVPGKAERTVADMTRKAIIGQQIAPRDSSLGLKGFSKYMGPRENSDYSMVGGSIKLKDSGIKVNDSSINGSSLSVDSVKRAKDSALNGDSIALKPNIRAKNGALNGDSIALRSNVKAKDSALNGDSIALRSNVKAKDSALNGDSIALRSNVKAKNSALNGSQVALRSNVKAKDSALNGSPIALRSNVRTKDSIISSSSISTGFREIATDTGLTDKSVKTGSGYKKAKELSGDDSAKNMQNFDTSPKSHLSANINTGNKINLRNNQKQATLPDKNVNANNTGNTGTIPDTDTISFLIKKKEERKEKKTTDQSDTSGEDDIFWIT